MLEKGHEHIGEAFILIEEMDMIKSWTYAHGHKRSGKNASCFYI